MLHQSVANLLVHVFEGANARATLQEYFVKDCNLLHRLVESFEEELPDKATSPPPPGADDDDDNNNEDVLSNDAVDAGDDDVLPISDDDVDAVLERQEDQQEQLKQADGETKQDIVIIEGNSMAAASQKLNQSMDLSVLKDMLNSDAPSHIPSLRKGYMGHVIIVCQALVHACTTTPPGGDENANFNESLNSNNNDIAGAGSGDDDGGEAVMMNDDHQASSDGSDDAIGEDDPILIIANLIASHPMQLKWQDFVTTTLASETAIQSTPLGGFHASVATIDPLQSHRPGPDMSDFHDDYDDDDDDDDDLPGGGVIDMDDNDIEIAASMMDALSLPKSREFNPDFGEVNTGNEYMFDDPLGSGARFDANFDDGTVEEDEEDPEAATRRASSELDPPVMDLFAGNMAFDSKKAERGSTNGGAPPSNWSADFANFDANFDDAFSAPEAMPQALEVVNPAVEPQPQEPEDLFATETAKNVDDIFGAPEHHELLLDADAEAEVETEVEAELEEIPMVSHYPSSRGRVGSDDDSSVDEDEEPPTLDDEDEQPAVVASS